MTTPAWLPLISKGVSGNGVAQTPRSNVDIVSTGATATDDPSTDTTHVTIPAGGGSGITSGDVSVTSGVARTLAIRSVPVASTAPLASQTLIAGASGAGYAPGDVDGIIHVDRYIDAAGGNVTTGVQNALNAFATATQLGASNGGAHSPRLVFGPKLYSLSTTVTCVGANGGIIEGHGWQQTYLLGPGGSRAIIQFVNCSYLTIRGMAWRVANPAIHPTAGASAGATTLSVPSGNTIANGKPYSLINAGATFGEVITVTSGGGTTTLTLATALRNSYTTSDNLYLGPVAGMEFFSDSGQAGFPATQNTVVDCASFNTAFFCATNCVGGTGSGSDDNNDGHVFERCRMLGTTSLAFLHIGHSQSLLHQINECAVAAVYGIECLTGGSFNAFGGEWNITGYTVTCGGNMGRPCCITDVCVTDAGGLAVQARASDSCVGLVLKMDGYTHAGAGGGTNQLLFDITGTKSQINLYSCFFAAGVGASALLLNFKDTAGVFLKSTVAIRDCQLGPYGGTADGVVVLRENSPWTAHGDGVLHENVANGGLWAGFSGGIVGNGATTGPDRFGALVGFSTHENVLSISAATYTCDSSATYEHTILANNTSTAQNFTLPPQYKNGRVMEFIAQSTAHSITLTAPGGSQVNGASTLVISTPVVGQTIRVVGDGTNWWGGH